MGLALGLGLGIARRVTARWTPAKLFASGAAGAWFEPSPATCYTDVAMTTPADYTDTVAACVASYGTAGPLLQATAAAEPQLTATPDRLVIDKIDDNLTIQIPTGGLQGTMVIGTTEGCCALQVDIPAGAHGLVKNGLYFPGQNIVGIVLINRTLSASEIAKTRAALVELGAAPAFTGSIQDYFIFWTFVTGVDLFDYSGITSLMSTFRSVPITSFPFTQLDPSKFVSLTMYHAFRDSGLVSADFTGLNFDLTHDWERSFNGCANLAHIVVDGAFDNSPITKFSGAWSGCALDQESVDALLVSINNAGMSAGVLGIDGGTNATPGPAGQAAADALRARGWTVALNGYWP